QRDVTVVQELDPTDAAAHQFHAARVEQTAGQPYGELMGIADAIAAGKTIVAKQLLVAECQIRSVEIGQVGLILELGVQVVELGLQGLSMALEEMPGIPLQVEAGIE